MRILYVCKDKESKNQHIFKVKGKDLVIILQEIAIEEVIWEMSCCHELRSLQILTRRQNTLVSSLCCSLALQKDLSSNKLNYPFAFFQFAF